MSTVADLYLMAQALLASSYEFTEEEFATMLVRFVGESDDKLARLAVLRRASLARQKELGAEVERLTAAKRAAARAEERALEGARLLLEARRELGEEPSVTGSWGYARLQKNSAPSVKIDDPAQLPSSLVHTTVEPDRERIRLALQGGLEVPGCSLVYGEHVRLG